jgi:hypothetical protein
VDTFVHHFEIHLAKKTIAIDDKDKEAQYGCCTFQTHRINKNQSPVQLAPAYKNMWANKWNYYWFYATILVIGLNA